MKENALKYPTVQRQQQRQQLSIEEMMSTTCSITSHEAENLIKKIDGFESRLIALESLSASSLAGSPRPNIFQSMEF